MDHRVHALSPVRATSVKDRLEIIFRIVNFRAADRQFGGGLHTARAAGLDRHVGRWSVVIWGKLGRQSTLDGPAVLALVLSRSPPKTETGQVPETRSGAAIHVAWTFMSEILANHLGIVERSSSRNNFRFDCVLWPCDGHECPSYMRRSAMAPKTGLICHMF